MAKVHVLDHPLIQHKVTIIRKTTTGTREFRQLVDEVAMLMAYEVTRDLPLEDVEIETPICKTVQKQISGKKLGLVPILRAGLGMIDGMLKLIPTAKVGHIGLYRDHNTLQPVEYFVKLPTDVEEREFIVVDPMLATGGSAIAAIQSLKNRGAKNIKFMCLIAAPEGVELLKNAHPDVDIFIAILDEKLNE
ncbi:MAG: upp, partial [Bacillales bacterium]|nr:upp [Bacillales bacterium]